MNDPTPPVPERFDDMHWSMMIFCLLLFAVLVVFWASVLLAMI
ncbi:hypothetical protein [Halorussus salinus]|nr:hypothetical protein [Halorussus salinus]